MASSLIPPGIDLCAIPAGVAPDGSLPNLVNPPSLETTTIVVAVLMTVWALTFVVVRVVVNRRKLSWSDHFMVIGMILDIAFTAVIIARAKYNRHLWDVPVCWLDARYIKLSFVPAILLVPTVFFSKSSIFLLYREIFSVKKSMHIAVYVGIVATFVTYFPHIPVSIRYISPASGKSWDDLVLDSGPKKAIYWGTVSGCLSVALDIFIFVLPLPTLATLNMSIKRRLQLIAVFATALMGIVAGVVALVYRVKALDISDATWQQGPLWIAIVVENNVVIIVGSMPAVATFMRTHVSESAIFKSLRSKIRQTSGQDSGKESKSSFRTPGLATFGSPNVQKRGNYELGDPTVTAPQAVSDGRYQSPGNHTAVYHQHYVQPNSTERLV